MEVESVFFFEPFMATRIEPKKKKNRHYTNNSRQQHKQQESNYNDKQNWGMLKDCELE